MRSHSGIAPSPGPSGRGHTPFPVDLRERGGLAPAGGPGRGPLEPSAVSQAERQMEGGQPGGSGAVGPQFDGRAVRRRQAHGPRGRRHAAVVGRSGPQAAPGAGGDPVARGSEIGERVARRHDRHAGGAPQLRIGRHVLVGEGSLEPDEPEFGQTPADPDGRPEVVAPPGGEHEGHARAVGGVDRPGHGEVPAGVAPGAEFHGPVTPGGEVPDEGDAGVDVVEGGREGAGRDPVPRAAQQPPQLSRRPRREVPQGDVDGGFRALSRVAARAQEPFRDRLAFERRGAQNLGRDGAQAVGQGTVRPAAEGGRVRRARGPSPPGRWPP